MKKVKIKFKRNTFNIKKLKAWARQVKVRDNFKCIACGYKGALHSHHVLKKSKHRKYVYDLRNGLTLCVLCHTGPNGVHGSKSPRNNTVKELRKLMKEGSFDKVLLFLSKKNISVEIKSKIKYKVRKPKRKYTPYKKFRRKLYQAKSK